LIEISSDSIPGFGKIATEIIDGTTNVATGLLTAQLNITNGYSGITCVGGASYYTGYGRYFMELGHFTSNYNVDVTTKDHINADKGQAIAQIITAYKKP
jgi:hypothetical protein